MILLAEHDESLLAAKKKRQHGASSRPTSTPKNRVWGFESTPSGRPVVEPQLTQENATGSVQYTYQNASGRAEWLSKDPAGESMGLNLYRYVSNNPLNYIDPNGLGQKDTRTFNINDNDVNNQMSRVYSKMNSESPGTFDLTDSRNWDPNGPFEDYMTGRADTQWVGDQYNTFDYKGKDYPGLNDRPMTGHDINYLALGAGFAAANVDVNLAIYASLAHYKPSYPGDSRLNMLHAMLAGYGAYKRTHTKCN